MPVESATVYTMVYCTVPTVTLATVGRSVAITITSVVPTPAPLGESVVAAPAQLPNLAAAPVLAKRPCVVISVEAKYKAVEPVMPSDRFAAVEPVKATKVSMWMLVIWEPAGMVNNVVWYQRCKQRLGCSVCWGLDRGQTSWGLLLR